MSNNQDALKVKLKMKKILVNAGYKDYWENEKFVNNLCSKNFIEFFFGDNLDYVYQSMGQLGCFKNLNKEGK